MADLLPGFPPERAGVDLVDGAAHIRVDADVYPLDAVYGAAYVFIDRCYVLIDRVGAGADPPGFRVTLAAKDQAAATAAALRELCGEFANELLSCAWRRQIAIENRATIEATTMQALSGAMGPPSLAELADFDFAEEPFEDPLGIATSWEDKYTKGDKGDKGAKSGKIAKDAKEPDGEESEGHRG
jgi:His-Xaa-Ser system protein HxsD